MTDTPGRENIPSGFYSSCLCKVCSRGNLALASWLLEDLTPILEREGAPGPAPETISGEAFVRACGSGNADLARYLDNYACSRDLPAKDPQIIADLYRKAARRGTSF